jgi:hypothetical protein
MELEDSLPSQHPTTGPHPKPNESSSHTYFFYDYFDLISTPIYA